MATRSRAKEAKGPLRFSEMLRKKPAFVTIIVGPTATKFFVHKDVICHESPFFSAAFDKNSKDGETCEMVLEDVDEEAFGMLASWLYKRQVELNPHEGLTEDEEDARILTLGKLWILARRFMIPCLEEETEEVIDDWVSTTWVPNLVHYYRFIFKEKAKPLIEMAVKQFACCIDCEGFDKYVHLLPPRMVVRVAKLLKQKVGDFL